MSPYGAPDTWVQHRLDSRPTTPLGRLSRVVAWEIRKASCSYPVRYLRRGRARSRIGVERLRVGDRISFGKGLPAGNEITTICRWRGPDGTYTEIKVGGVSWHTAAHYYVAWRHAWHIYLRRPQ